MEELNSWMEEQRSAYLYNIIAEIEPDAKRKKLFHDLANAAIQQAAIWEIKILAVGARVPAKYTPDFRAKIVAVIVKIFGTKRSRSILAAMKVRGMSVYLSADPQYPYPASGVAEHEHRHKGTGETGGNIRAAIFGVNDGLISNASLMLGIVGANANHHFIVLSGVAGLLAGACSMSAGEFISVRSQRELFDYQIDLERSELELYPQEEAAELSMIYQARGLPKEEADSVAKKLISMPDKALDTLAREELGINEAELSSPYGAAVSSFFSFSIGAFIPLLPFLLGNYRWSLYASITLTGISLFSIGASLSLFTSQNAFKSGIRMLLIGLAAGCATYLIGSLLGVEVH